MLDGRYAMGPGRATKIKYKSVNGQNSGYFIDFLYHTPGPAVPAQRPRAAMPAGAQSFRIRAVFRFRLFELLYAIFGLFSFTLIFTQITIGIANFGR
jgi:hypothetical protein